MDRGKNQTTQRVAMFVIAALTLSTTLNAQRPLDRTKGFVLGVHTVGATGLTLSGADMENGDLTTSFGAGAGLMLGYGFTKSITGYASFDVAKQGPGNGEFDGNLGLSHVEVGARAYLPLGTGATMPYVTGSFGRRVLAAKVNDFSGSYDMSFTGTALGLGGGVEHAISPSMAFDGGVEATFGRFSHAKIADLGGSIDLNGTTSIRLKAGMTWRPGRNR